MTRSVVIPGDLITCPDNAFQVGTHMVKGVGWNYVRRPVLNWSERDAVFLITAVVPPVGIYNSTHLDGSHFMFVSPRTVGWATFDDKCMVIVS